MSTNEAQREYWNGEAGQTWARAQQRLDELLAPISDELVERANVVAGERVIDIGCGCGATSVELSDQGGVVQGIDLSEPMLAVAKQRAGDRPNLTFSLADAATEAFPSDTDLLFSRFGVMFFADPIAAFQNLRGALNPEGRLLFGCWQAPRDNPWLSLVGAAIAPLLPEPETPPDPKEPGPFAFADADYLRNILDAAGFTHVNFKALAKPLRLADDVAGAVEALSEVGPLARALAELDGQTKAEALEVAASVLETHSSPDGVVLDSAVWIVSARNSGA